MLNLATELNDTIGSSIIAATHVFADIRNVDRLKQLNWKTQRETNLKFRWKIIKRPDYSLQWERRLFCHVNLKFRSMGIIIQYSLGRFRKDKSLAFACGTNKCPKCNDCWSFWWFLWKNFLQDLLQCTFREAFKRIQKNKPFFA